MSVFDIFRMAFINLWRRKLRAILTALGMAIGTTSIVVMVSIGIGLNVSMEESFARMGGLTKIEVMQGGGYVWDEYGNGTKTEEILLNDDAINTMKTLEHVTAVMPVMQYGGNVKCGRYTGWVQLYGIDLENAALFDIAVDEGEMPGKGNRRRPEVLMTNDMVYSFWDSRTYNSPIDKDGNPLIDLMEDKIKFSFDYSAFENTTSIPVEGETPQPKGKIYDLKVTGLYDSETRGNFYNAAFMDVNTFKELMKDNEDFTGYDPKKSKYDTVWVKVDDMDHVSDVAQQIRDMGYNAYAATDYLNEYKNQMKTTQAVLGAIGAVAMLVAAIGIMNTMMMSIYERTKEIGVIKVLGCKMSNIRRMFLVESAYIGIFGGALGLIFSFAVSFILSKLLADMGMRSVIPFWLAGGAVLFSGGVAMISGLYPALRAMRLSALDAIRNQ